MSATGMCSKSYAGADIRWVVNNPGIIVIPQVCTTGDGIATGLLMMEQLAVTGRRLADLSAIMKVLPQELINVRVADKHAVACAPEVQAAVDAAEAELAGNGRVLLRPREPNNWCA